MTEKLLEAFDRDEIMIQLKKQKEAILQDDSLMQVIAAFNQEKQLYEQTGYLSERLKELKIELYQHHLIKAYKQQEKMFNQRIERLNRNFNHLIHDDKICIKKSHKK